MFVGWTGSVVVAIALGGALGCNLPCKRTCAHVFDECGLSDHALDEEARCLKRCESAEAALPGPCAHPEQLEACFLEASCEELRSGRAEARCASTCGEAE